VIPLAKEGERDEDVCGTGRDGEVLGLLENWRGASFADVNQLVGFGEPGKGAPHGNENTGFAAHT